MSYQEFVDKWNNKGCDFDGFYGFQCMDLAHQYAKDVVGHDFAAAPAAKDVWNQIIDGYDKISNTPDGVPQKGDIVVWGTAIGQYGHIAVFDHGDTSSFVSFDQNWPTGSVCHFQNHNYTGVLGWFHPKNIEQQVLVDPKIYEMLVTKATERDKFVSMGFNSPDDLQKTLDTNKKTLDSLTKKNQELETRNSDNEIEISTLSEQIGSLTEVNEELKTKISTLEQQVPTTPPTTQTPPNQPNPAPDAPSQTTGSGISDTTVGNFFKAILAWLRGK